MNNHIQLVLKSSTTELSLNDRDLGIYIVPELEGLTGLPEIRTTSGVNAGYDGGWTSAQNYDARSITIRGVIANTDVATVERLRRQLTALAGQGKKEELTLNLVTEAGNAYTLQVRTIALEMALQKVVYQQEFLLQLRADDPLIYDASETGHEALLQVAQATGGFTIDFNLPLAITGSSEETVVNNDGLEQVPTITRMYGSLHNPKIINQTTNQFMQIEADLGFAEGEWIEPSDAITGSNITVGGAPEGAPFADVQLEGNTSQQTYTGKNLCSGVNQNYWLNVGANSAGQTPGNSGVGISVSANTNYTISTRVSQARYRAALVDSLPTSNTGITAYSGQVKDGTTNSITINSGSHGYLIVNATSLTDIQIEVGSSATSFEPYVGGVPAPNPNYPQAVKTVTGENIVSIVGKNLCGIPDQTFTYRDIDFTIEDGVITMNGTASSGGTKYLTPILPLVLDGDYTVNLIYVSGTTTGPIANLNIRKASDSSIIQGTQTNIAESNTNRQFTIAKTDVIFGLYVQSGSSFNNLKIKPQIVKGTNPDYNFEPFIGGSYEINLGKNLFDKDNVNDVNGTVGSTNLSLGGANYFIYIPCQPNTTYTLQKRNDGDTNRFAVATTAAVPTAPTPTYDFVQDNNASSITITTSSTARYIVVMYYRTAEATLTKQQLLDSIQIELGSQATSYAPYFTPIELCKIGTYQDYVYPSGGKWYVHKETGHDTRACSINGIAQNQSAGETVASYSGAFCIINSFWGNDYSTTAGLARLSEVLGIYQEQTLSGNGAANSMVDGTFCQRSGTNDRLYFRNTAYTGKTGNEIKAMIDANGGVSLWWPLATPTDTEITNAALVAQLEALAAATMYNPQTNIAALYAEGNEQGTLSISYYTDKNPDTRDELVIDSRLRTITLNGLDVYHLQAPGSEFLMLAPGENRLSLQSDITGDNGYAQVSYKQGYLSI